MGQLKVCSLLILAIITLNSGCAEKNNSDCINILFYAKKTEVVLFENEYLLTNTEELYELYILNEVKLNSIKELENSSIVICLNGNKKMVKGIDLFSSQVPQKADYFFSENKEKKIVFFKRNKIKFRKVIKSQ